MSRSAIVLAAGFALSALLAGCGSGTTPSAPAPVGGGSLQSVSTAPALENNQPPAGVHIFPPHTIIGSGMTAQVANTANNLIYQNGQVMTFPAIGLVYWGFNRPNADPYGEIPFLNDFLMHLRASGPMNVVTQYYEIANGQKYYIPNYPAMSIAIWKDDANPLPAPHPTDADIQAEALRAAAQFKFALPGVDNLIIVAVPHGIPMNYAACAYNGKTHGITYTNLPYQPDFGAGCGAYSVDPGPKGILDGVTETAIHEIAESMTDPLFGGWLDAQGAEIGDKCQQYAAHALFDGKEFPVQPLWSNRTGDCRY